MTIEALRQMELSAKQAKTEKGKVLANAIADAIRKGIDGGVLKADIDVLDCHPEIILNKDTRIVAGLRGKQEKLAPKQEELLRLLLLNTGKVLSVAEIHNRVSGWAAYGEKAVDSPLRPELVSLRGKLRNIGACNEVFPEGYILSVPGSGMVLIDPCSPDQVAKYRSFARIRR